MAEQKLIRAVGFWGLVAMCINAVIGSGVFLLPTESYKLLGPFSLWAPLIFALPVFILVLCFAEAASHFTEPGGAYLYARTAFGDFVGFETGWMNWIARLTSLASLTNGFVISLALFFPGLGSGAARAASIPNLSATKTPIASAAAEIVGPIGAIVVTLGALLSMAGTNSGTVLEGSRMLYALSLDRRLGPVSFVHPRFRTPTVAIAIHVVVAAGFALGGSFAKLAMLSAVARLTTYLFTCAAIPRLGRMSAGRWLIAILGTAVSLGLVSTLNRFNFLAAAIALLVGAVVWFVSTKR